MKRLSYVVIAALFCIAFMQCSAANSFVKRMNEVANEQAERDEKQKKESNGNRNDETKKEEKKNDNGGNGNAETKKKRKSAD